MADSEHDEDFLSRWSRRKTQARQPGTTGPLANQRAPSTQARSPAAPPATATDPERLLTDADMPPLETLGPDSDYSGFLSQGVSEALRRQALARMFRSPSFNVVDGLDDYAEDFTQFAPLGDVVTADMRHRLEQQQQRTAEIEHAAETDRDNAAQRATNRSARALALEAMAAAPLQPTGLIEYNAGNRLLVVGDDAVLVERAVRAAGATVAPSVLVVVAAEGTWQLPIAGVTTWHVLRDDIELRGWLGGFQLRLASQGDGAARFDQVLDLCATPLLTQELSPPGYLTADETDVEARVENLRDLIGQFEKPKYFRYDPDICAHGMKGATACSRCIEACPAGAITSLVERVSVEPHLCQGGGACATACPSGAMSYGYPMVADTLERVRRMLRAYRDAGGEAPVLLVHDSEAGAEPAQAWLAADDETASRLLPLAVEEVASLGLEAWLTALAYGARAVRLLGHSGIPRTSRAVVQEQLVLADQILSGMGYPSGVLAWGETATTMPALMPAIEPARHAAIGDKRQILFQAIDHLLSQSPRCAVAGDTALELPIGSPLGTTHVDQDACTLCMACVTVCPAKALQPGQDVPQLRFRESNCVQCGLCVQSCPEAAITIRPRLLLDADARNAVRLLNEDAPFHCLSCGSAFATRAVIGRMQERLADHSMFSAPAARRRLQLCGECRVADMMQAGEL